MNSEGKRFLFNSTFPGFSGVQYSIFFTLFNSSIDCSSYHPHPRIQYGAGSALPLKGEGKGGGGKRKFLSNQVLSASA
jgi:hypothetical protein